MNIEKGREEETAHPPSWPNREKAAEQSDSSPFTFPGSAGTRDEVQANWLSFSEKEKEAIAAVDINSHGWCLFVSVEDEADEKRAT